MNKNIITYGVSSSYSKAQNTIATLKQAGFLDSDLLVLFASSIDSKRFANENHINTTDDNEVRTYSGAAIGAFLGWLAMAGFGIITIPLIGYFILVTPVLGGIIGAGIGDAINGVIEVLHKLGMSDDEAKNYESFVNEGNIFLLVSVSNEKLVKKAEEVLKITEVEKIQTKYLINNVEIDKLTGKKTEGDNQNEIA